MNYIVTGESRCTGCGDALIVEKVLAPNEIVARSLFAARFPYFNIVKVTCEEVDHVS
jgi:hypothetical protein